MRYFLTIFLGCSSLLLMAQPFINSVDPIAAGFDETITISGSGFSTTANLNDVFLGSGKATVQSATANLLTVKVPSTATSGPIVVTNRSTGLSGNYSNYFRFAFGATNFDVSNFATQFDVNTGEVQTYDICSCDFDQDGDNDLAVTNNELPSVSGETSELLVYDNASTTAGGVVLNGPTRLGVLPTIKVTCADLNADGFPDIVATEGGTGRNEVFIFQNVANGTIGFNAPISIEVPRDAASNLRFPEVVEIGDMDGDGKPDIVVGNSTDSSIDIFLNQSTTSSFSFNTTSTQVSTPSGSSASRGIALGDLNGDNSLEIVVSENNDETIFALRNESTKGNIKFTDIATITSDRTSLRNIELGDWNSDGLLDIAATDVNLNSFGQPGNVVIARNTTSQVGALPTFDSPVEIAANLQAWGLAVGDIDGDGDVDIAVASESNSAQEIDILINNSTSSTISFTNNNIALSTNARNIGIADINGDAKADLYFTANSLTNTVGSISVILNRNCVIPVIDPISGTYCSTVADTILATAASGSTYAWQVDAGAGFVAAPGSNTTNKYNIGSGNNTTDISVSVTLSTNDGSCAVASANNASLNVRTVSTAAPTITTPGSVCAGQDLILSTSNTAANYYWSGPNDLDTVITSSTFTIPAASATKAGVYTLQTEDTGSCKSVETTDTVQVFSVPIATVINDNEDVFCEGGTASLRIQELPGFTYQWLRNSGNISGATTTSVSADRTGEFSITLTDANSCSATSVPLSISEVVPPSTIINASDEICINVPLTISSSSVGSSGFSLSYSWNFLSPTNVSVGNSTDSSTIFTFTEAGQSFASLTTEYVELAGCNSTLVDTILVSVIPEIPITAPNGLEKCPSDSLMVEMPEDLVSYNWVDISDGNTDTLTQYSNENVAFVTTEQGQTDASIEVTVVTSIGCTVTSNLDVGDFPNAGVIIGSPEFEIINGTVTVPPMTNGVSLTASNGMDYLWEPKEIFSDSTDTEVRVFPRFSTTTVTLTGTDANGCRESETIVLQNDNLTARKGFSPNNDGIGFDCWEVLNTSTISGCTAYVFDNRGRNVLVADSPFENDCVWDGNTNGSPAPVGVYYYVLKCDDSQLSQSGSIILAR